MAEDGNERVFAVQLDVRSKDEFDLDQDHFILVTEEVLRQETSERGDVHIDTSEPGNYKEPFSGYVDNWNALFEYLTGTTLEEDASEILQDPRLESISPTAPYYWVNQSMDEIEDEYLQAPTDDYFQYDLPKLEPGDVVFSYSDGQVQGYHEVTEPAEVREIPAEEASSRAGDTEFVERYIVETSFTSFDEPLEFANVFAKLWEEEVRLEQYYPVNPGGINQRLW